MELGKETEKINLNFEDFKKLSLDKVRKDNCLDLVESWEENLLHKDFHQSPDASYYSAKIYFIEEYRGKNHDIKVYSFSYLANHEIFFNNDYFTIDRLVLNKIALLENLMSSNKEEYLYETLKLYQEKAEDIKN